MSNSENRSNSRRVVVIVLAVVLLLVLLLVGRCVMVKKRTAAPEVVPSPAQPTPAGTAPAPVVQPAPTKPTEAAPGSTPAPTTAEKQEDLTPATLTAPARVSIGAEFEVSWTGPDNAGDFVTIVPTDAPKEKYGNYVNTSRGKTVTLTAPMDASGSDAAKNGYEVRYVTARSHTVLGRAAIEVSEAGATLRTPMEATAGSEVEVSWTGPNNPGDYITVAMKDWPDAKYGNYELTVQGSPLRVRALPDAGEAEVRYVSGQGGKVLGRRAITLVAATATLTAPLQVVAGATIEVAWSGPNASGDYITIVEKGAPDDKYGNYTNTSGGSPLKLRTPVMPGDAEVRYVMSQGRKVLARRAIVLTQPEVTLTAPDECAQGAEVSITWAGPNFSGDYITIVAKGAADSVYGAYLNTSAGSPLRVAAPKDAGDAEVRYVSGQGGKVLARRAIRVK